MKPALWDGRAVYQDYEGRTIEHEEPPRRGECRCEALRPQWQAHLLCAECGGWIPAEHVEAALRLVMEQLQ